MAFLTRALREEVLFGLVSGDESRKHRGSGIHEVTREADIRKDSEA